MVWYALKFCQIGVIRCGVCMQSFERVFALCFCEIGAFVGKVWGVCDGFVGSWDDVCRLWNDWRRKKTRQL